jgi:uncharacterized Zn finger protein (UPF0148 family)
MTQFKCNEPGCPYVSDREENLSKHYRNKHKKKYMGGGAQPDDSVPEEGAIDESGMFNESDPSEEYNPMNVLKAILDNFGLTARKNAIVNLFSNYQMDDVVALERILRESGFVKPNVKSLILETYAKNLGIKVKGDDVEEEEIQIKGKKTTIRDPTAMSPAEIAAMSPGELAMWQADLNRYGQALMFQQKAMSTMYGNLGGFGTMAPGVATGALPPEVQQALNELKEIKERDKMREMISPLARRLDDLTEMMQGGAKKGGSSFDDLKEYAMTMKMLETLGSDKNSQSVQQMAEQRLEVMRQETARIQAQQNAQISGLRDQATALQIKNIQDAMAGQMAVLQNQLQNANTSKQTLVQSVQEMLGLQKALSQLTTGQEPETPEERKAKSTEKMIESVMTGVSPALTKLAEGFGAAKTPNMAMAPVNGIPLGQNVENVGEDMHQMVCTKCGKPFPFAGNPPMLQCPNCGMQYKQQGKMDEPPANPNAPMSDVYVSGPKPGNKEPTDDEIVKELTMMPREQLDQLASDRGIDPDMYPNKIELSKAIARLRK